MSVLPFPRVLRIEPASSCNLECIHCPTGTLEMSRRVMSDEILQKTFQEVKTHKQNIKIIVLYHGGEPLLNKNFASIVKELKGINKDFFIKTVSNGMLLTDDKSLDIVNSQIDAIEFSLDGASPQESEFIRRKSDSSKVIKNIKNLISIKKELNSNLPNIYISTTQFFSKEYPLTNYPPPKVPKWLLGAFKKEDICEFKTTYAMQWPHMGDSGNFEYVKVDTAPKDTVCDHVINTITIRADGTVVPCCFDLTTKYAMGNIMMESLESIWNNERYIQLRHSLQTRDYKSICKKCLIVNPPIYLVPKFKI